MSRQLAVPGTHADRGAQAAPRSFVDAKQRFVSLFASEKTWAYVMTGVALLAWTLLGLLALMNIQLQSELAQRQVVIVGETTAKQLVPLWPNGVGSTSCDDSCVVGSLEAWIPAFRKISGERDHAQVEQHNAADETAAFIEAGSPAATVVTQYNQRYPAFDLAAKGVRLDVPLDSLHVVANHMSPNHYTATWTDVVTDEKTHHEIGRHAFSADIEVKLAPQARTEQSIRWNPGGVYIHDLHLFGES